MNRNNKLMNLQRFAGSDGITHDNVVALMTEQSGEIINGVIAKSAVLSMGKRLKDMNSNTMAMPVQTAFVIPQVVGATGKKAVESAEWDKKVIYAGEIACLVPVKDADIADASYDIWSSVKEQLIDAFGATIDRLVLAGGSDVPAGWPAGLIPMATDAGAVVTETGDLYADLLGVDGAISKVEECGYDPNGYVGSTKMKAKLRGLRDENGYPIFLSSVQEAGNYTLNGNKVFIDKNGIMGTGNLLITGDFSKLVYSIRQDITFSFSNSAVITNSDGTVAHSSFEEDMTVLRAVMRLGYQVPNPVTMKKGKADAATRFPFSVLKENNA